MSLHKEFSYCHLNKAAKRKITLKYHLLTSKNQFFIREQTDSIIVSVAAVGAGRHNPISNI